MNDRPSQTKPMIPWIGGKRRLAATILPMFASHSCYVEPFAGAGALFFAKEPVKAELLNDINRDLVLLYRVVQHHLDEFVRHFRWALASREMYKWTLETKPETLTDIQRAARFFYLMKCGFGGKLEGQTFGTATTSPARLNLLRLEEDLSAVHLRLHQVMVENLPWADCVKKYDRPHTLFYMDPPYYGTEGYGVDFGLEQYELMAELMRSMKGKAVVSVNDIPAMRKAFDGFKMDTVGIRYTVGVSGQGRDQKQELIISNY